MSYFKTSATEDGPRPTHIYVLQFDR